MDAYYTLTVRDVGKPWIRAFGHAWLASDFIGRILPQDVGKRVYQRPGGLQVENNAQRDARLGMQWVTFTRRTDDPKLAWLEDRLSEAGIPHRRSGSSVHAPILQVPQARLDDARGGS